MVEVFQMNMPLFHRYCSEARYAFAVSRSGFSTNLSTANARPSVSSGWNLMYP